MIKIGFIDDDYSFIKSLREALHFEPDIYCLISASSPSDFWNEWNTRMNLDLIFIDINMGKDSGISMLPSLRKVFPKAELVMLTIHEDKNLLFKALNNGADGYLIKNFQALQFPKYIRIFNEGGALISPKMARWVIQYFHPQQKSSHTLNDKDLKILQLFAQGYSYEEAANTLGISVNGIRYYVKKIYGALNVTSKIDAIRIVQDRISPKDNS